MSTQSLPPFSSTMLKRAHIFFFIVWTGIIVFVTSYEIDHHSPFLFLILWFSGLLFLAYNYFKLTKLLAENENYFEKAKEVQHILEKTPSVIFLWQNKEGWPIELVTENVYTLFGRTSQEFLSGKISYAETIHPGDLQRVGEEVAENSIEPNTNQFTHEYRIINSQGKIRWLQDNTIIRRNSKNEVTHYQGVVTDITEQVILRQQLEQQYDLLDLTVKQRTQELLANKERLELAMQVANDGIWDWNIQTNVVNFDHRYYTMLGYEPHEFPENFEEFEKHVHADDLDATKKQLADYLLGKLQNYLVEFRFLTKNDGYIWIQAIGKIVAHDKHGNPLRMLGTHTNIERRKQSEFALVDARKKADFANTAKSTFLANMSHEIRTPMNAIIGLTHILQRDNPTPQQEVQLSKLDSSAIHLLSIINDILDLSKIESGKLSLENTVFSLSSVLEQIELLIKNQCQTKDLNLEISSSCTQDTFYGEPTRIRQALLNYTANAIKFTEQGSIKIHVKELSQQRDQFVLKFSVADTGIGIEKGSLNKVFDTFTQADLSTTRLYGGSGLGLSITKKLVNLMNGKVGVESELGEGSTFWFTVTIDKADEHASEHLTNPAIDSSINWRQKIEEELSGSTILLVEDNLINSEVASDVLNSVGLIVDTAENGQECIDKLKQKSFDLILMDIQMPIMDGLKATKIIRSMPEYAKLPILAMTANVFEEDRKACLSVGMNDFVAKPIDTDNLFATIFKALKGSNSSQDNTTSIQTKAPTAVIESIDKSALTKMFGDNPEKHKQLLNKFLAQAKTIVISLSDFQDKRDAEQVSFLGHKLKSSARTVGANNLSDICFSLEKAGKNENWNKIDQLEIELQTEMLSVVNYIEDL